MSTAADEVCPAHTELRARLYRRFRGSSEPVLMGPGFGIPGASLWSGARAWIDWLRQSGICRGLRVGVALPVSPASVMLTIACWWEGVEVRVIPAIAGVNGSARVEDVDLLVGGASGRSSVIPGSDGVPVCRPMLRRRLACAAEGSLCALSWMGLDVSWEWADVLACDRGQRTLASVTVAPTWHGPSSAGRLWGALWQSEVITVSEVPVRASSDRVLCTQPWGGVGPDVA